MELKTNKHFRIIPDLHGDLDLLKLSLSKWDKEKEHLIFLGDLIDRGSNSLTIVRTVKGLVDDGLATCIRGNHELMFNWYINGSNYNEYLSNFVGGMPFLENFIEELLEAGHKVEDLGNADYLLPLIRKEYKDIIDFMKDLPLYVDTKDIFFTHAAVTHYAEEIHQMKENDFLWGYTNFEYCEPVFNKFIVVGHLPTFRINKDKSSSLYFGPNNKVLFTDGGPFLKTETSSFHNVLIKTTDKYFTIIDDEIFLYAKEPYFIQHKHKIKREEF